jgi:hypothetical protein
MKTMIDTKRTSKVMVTIVMLTMVAVAGYGQGLLIEGAARLFNSLRESKAESVSLYINANYIPSADAEGDSFRFNTAQFLDMDSEAIDLDLEIGAEILFSFYVNNLEVSYENELLAESWMTEPFSNEMEAAETVESWMTEPFNNEMEAAETVESWMTEPFSNEMEAAETVESWMAEPFSNEMEAAETVESWMTEPFSNELEAAEAIEPWMTQVLFEEEESDVEVESWMTVPVYASAEGAIELEGWMTTPLR